MRGGRGGRGACVDPSCAGVTYIRALGPTDPEMGSMGGFTLRSMAGRLGQNEKAKVVINVRQQKTERTKNRPSKQIHVLQNEARPGLIPGHGL